MRLQRIDGAEAIIEPFFDGSDSSRENWEIPQLTHYAIERSDETAVRVYQEWDGVGIDLARGAKRHVVMTRSCGIDISDYDTFRLFGAVPASMRLTIHAVIDGEDAVICENMPGTGDTDEYNCPIRGNRLDALTICLDSDGEDDAHALFEWLGLTDTAREAAMLARRSVFPADWPDMLTQGGFEPEIGLFFGREDVAALRAKVRAPVLSDEWEKLRTLAIQDLNSEPEKDIGTFVPQPDRRWVMARDRNKKSLCDAMERLAFVGLIEKNPEMMTMAVRMALSAAHCEYWTESIMGALPGCAWHHRSFTETAYSRAVALVMDWAGSWLTSYGRGVLIDALVMKGLPRIQSDFRRQEYIRSMNQGPWFNMGRAIIYLACRGTYPRYEGDLAETERDLFEMLDNYIMPDGGTPEGPSYWSGTFAPAMATLELLARCHGKSIRDMATHALEKTGLAQLFELSVTGDGSKFMPINDCGGGSITPQLLCQFYNMTGRKDYLELAAIILRNSDAVQPPQFFIAAPEAFPQVERYVRSGFSTLPDLGQAKIVREDRALGMISFVFLTGLADQGHFHMDKGSIILETEKEHVFIDRGALSYSRPDNMLVQLPGRHSLFCPEFEGADATQSPGRDTARLLSATCEDGVFQAEGDATRAWNDPRIAKSTRKITSADAREYVIEDELILTEEAPAAFLLQTVLPCAVEDGRVIARGETLEAVVEPVGWRPEISCAPFGVNAREQTVNRIAMRSAKARAHHVVTRITLREKR